MPRSARQKSALERRLVGVAVAAVGRPRVGVLARAALGPLAAGWPAAARPSLAAAIAVGPRGPVDLGRGVAQRGSDVIDLDLVHGPLLALLGLIRPLPQPSRDDDPHSPGQ